MKYESRADLLIAAGESIKMQEKAGINPWFKYDGIKFLMTECQTNFIDQSRYEFPIAVVEGKPVFVGDELWNVPNNFKFTVRAADFQDSNCCLWNRDIHDDCSKGRIGGWLKDMSWNSQKPKTVMVELLREDAEWMVRAYDGCNSKAGLLAVACRKALER